MQDAIKIASSHTLLLFQFHINASNMTTLSCFMYKINWSNCYSEVNLVNCPHTMWASSVDQTWDSMVGTPKVVNSSNSGKIKFVRVLNKLGVVHIVPNTSQTPMVWSTNYLAPNSSSFRLNKYWMFVVTIVAINTPSSCFCLSWNISFLLLDEELEPSMLEEAISSKE